VTGARRALALGWWIYGQDVETRPAVADDRITGAMPLGEVGDNMMRVGREASAALAARYLPKNFI